MTRRVNLIPAAGAGKRFTERGYTTPKPLLPVGSAPMLVQAARSLPEADHWIFACRSEQLTTFPIERALRDAFASVEIIEVERLTEGQAATCLLAAPLLRDDDTLTIGPCDSAVRLSPGKAPLANPADAATIYTFRGDPAVRADPRMYGWVDLSADGAVRRVSVKVPLSDTPLNDHAVVGAFSFRRAADFVAAAQETIAFDRRVRGEFYMDEVMNQVVAAGLRVGIVEVAEYIGWGTPDDYERNRHRVS
jgi:NDP-sugar pyrophosphorylase family protein